MKQEQIEALIQDMTLEEKLGQMTQLAPFFFGTDENVDLTGPMAELRLSDEDLSNIGSTLNCFGARQVIELQKKYMEHNRHHIPLLFMGDVIHGFKTVFPIPLALGCSFNPENYRNAASVAAAESSASGIQLTFSPMSDLVRDPRWGRVMESPGEDPYLNSLMTAAAVNGFQGNDLKEKGKVASCIKHFAGYGAVEGGREYNWVDLSENTLRQFYLPSYKACLDAGARMVMTSFNVINGVPSSANKMLFRDILREEWEFDGSTISDYAAVQETVTNGLARDGKDAAKQCIEAGVDIEMMSTNYLTYGKQLVEEGLLSMDLIDQAVRNILNLKNELGLFENPFKDASEEAEKELHRCPAHRALAQNAAHECVVLLKNDNAVLPLKAGSKIGVAGPFANARNTSGGWSLVAGQNTLTLAESLTERGFSVVSAMDGELGSMDRQIFDVEDHVEEALEVLSGCEIVIAAVGECSADIGEATSKTCLRLSPNQEKLIRSLKEAGKTVITLVFSGRPLEIKPVLPYSDALVQAWFLGSESAAGLTDVLSGDYNPSGRLSMSFPQTVGQIPVYYNSYRTGRPYYGQEDHFVSKYLDCPNEPLFSFGYGLSYSTVEYSDFKVAKEGETCTASITVRNTSGPAVKETVQLYIRDCYADVVRPVKELKGFKQVDLAPGEAKTVTFTITKDMLMFYNRRLEYVFEPGEFAIMVGPNSVDLAEAVVTIE